MKMTGSLRLGDARQLLKLLQGVDVPRSGLSEALADELLRERVLTEIPKGRGSRLKALRKQTLADYLAQHYGVTRGLEAWIEAKTASSRAEQVACADDSKVKKVRTFPGFLVNSYAPIQATLAGRPLLINPQQGTSVFIHDWQHFSIPEDVVVVGMENGENFHDIRSQRHLFSGITPLFVTRYPQSSDLRRWLQMIPNRYLHFGDFDLAGIHIYLTEFYHHLGERSSFFVPEDVELRIAQGNPQLYDEQYAKYSAMAVTDPRVQPLVDLIHRHRRVYEQEGYINSKYADSLD